VKSSPARAVAGIFVLACLGVVAIVLGPPHLRNLELSGALQELVAQPDTGDWPDERFQVAASNQAQQMGIPVRPDQVKVQRSAGGIRLEVRYQVPMSLTVYTVNLQMRARGGS
jgi:hypothetical protein